MSEPIIVNFESQTVTQSGHTCYHAVDGKKYYVHKTKTIKIPLNTDAKILCSVWEKLHWINWAGPANNEGQPKETAKPIPQAPKTVQNSPKIDAKPVQTSKYSEADKAAFKAKSEQIRDIAALNNSVGMVQACANSITDNHFANMTLAEVVKYWKELHNQFYKEFYAKLLPSGDKTSPTDKIDQAEVVENDAQEEVPF